MKMTTSALAVLLLSGLWSRTQAQAAEPGRHSFALSTGLLIESMRDEQASPLRYSATSPLPVQINYRFKGANNWHDITLNFRQRHLTSSISTDDTHIQEGPHVRFTARYGRRVAGLSGNRSKVFIGFASDNLYNFRKHHYTTRFSEFVGSFSSTLNLTGAYRVTSGRNAYTLRTELPAAALVIHPPYSVKGSMETHIMGFDGFQRFYIAGVYERQIGYRLSLCAAFDWTYYRFRDPLPGRMLLNHVTGGLRWSFG